MDIGSIFAIIPLGFVAGVLARVLTPNDAFNQMSGPKSWAISLVLGVAGALAGYWFFTSLLGIGDTDVFDWGGIIGAVIGAMVVTVVASFVLRRARQ
ncbi:MAG: GlsB/YeaQ/YmgE family stress response membrane protein [Nitriliruptoraceae bacterium]